MQNHLQQDLSVGRLADKVGLSGRQLVRRFQKALHRSVTDELLRQRLAEANLLLRSTDIRVIDVASKVGFLQQPTSTAPSATPSARRLKTTATRDGSDADGRL